MSKSKKEKQTTKSSNQQSRNTQNQRKTLLKSGLAKLKSASRTSPRFYIIVDEDTEKWKKQTINDNLFKIFFPSQTIKDVFYFYLDYETYVKQSLNQKRRDYYEPTTNIHGFIDEEYFQLYMG